MNTKVTMCIWICIAEFAFVSSLAADKPEVIPNINKSTEYAGVYHSPSADSTPSQFRSILQLEVVVKRGDKDAEIIYANGTVVSEGGIIASVIDAPNTNTDESGGIVSASILTLEGGGAPALPLSTAPLVAKR